MDMNHIVQIEIGDSSGDGHDKRELFTFSCTHSAFDVREAFRRGSEIVGFNLTEYCEAYEDNSVPQEVFEKLKEHGAISSWLANDIEEYNNGEPYLDQETYVKSYMIIAQKGLPELRYSMRRSPAIKAGGYGLFS